MTVVADSQKVPDLVQIANDSGRCVTLKAGSARVLRCGHTHG